MLRLLFFLLPLCVSAQRHADCDSALLIMEKTRYEFAARSGEGADAREAAVVACFVDDAHGGRAEKNSTWLRFRIDTSGTLLFAITPAIPTDDLNFVLYRLPDGDCAAKKLVRCMAAAAPPGQPVSLCAGATGLAAGENDVTEDAGCADDGDNNWLAPLRAKAGELYALLISNMSSENGFVVELSGTAVLRKKE